MVVDEFGREIPVPTSSQHRGSSYNTASASHYSDNSRGQTFPTATGSYHHNQPRRNNDHYIHKHASPKQYGSGGRSTASQQQQQHPSQAYTDAPLLCLVVWKEEDGKDTVKAVAGSQATTSSETTDAEGPEDKDKATSSNVTQAPSENESDSPIITAYQKYKQQYCLRYVRSVLNHHLDDTWFRAITSPLAKYRHVQANCERAYNEAAIFQKQVVGLLLQVAREVGSEAKASATLDDISTMSLDTKEMHRLFDQAVSLSHGRKAVSQNHQSEQDASSAQPNAVPSLHSLSILETCLVVHDLPSYVTGEQVLAAVAAATIAPARTSRKRGVDEVDAAEETTGHSLPTIYSTNPLPEHGYVRSALVVYTSIEETREAWKLLRAQTSAPMPAMVVPAVPRRHHYSYSQQQNEQATINIDATDAYGRREVDANGSGGPPSMDGESSMPMVLPLRSVQCVVTRLVPQATTRVSVLSASLSTMKRVADDFASARQIAEVLDLRYQVPEEQRLDRVLSVLQEKLGLSQGQGEALQDASLSNDVALSLLLDTCLAYLRRVHLISFYRGLGQIDFLTSPGNVADVVLGGMGGCHHNVFLSSSTSSTVTTSNKYIVPTTPASTLYLRLENADSLLETATNVSAEDVRREDRQQQHDSQDVNDGTDAVDESTERNSMNGDVDASVHQAEDAALNSAQTAMGTDKETSSKPVVHDLLVQRLDTDISKALEHCQAWMQHFSAAPVVVSEQIDRDAKMIEHEEQATIERWIKNHSILDSDGRARCSFHFCHKLFKNASFLHKHLIKKHAEFLKAEQAKCHDQYMMDAWDSCETRPVPDVLVDCGKQFGLVPARVFGREPDCVDPEPELWQREEDKRQREEEARQRREAERQQRRQQQPGQFERPPSVANYVDVDEMKEEKIDVSFDNIEVPDTAVKKKKRKRKLL